jgi:hypothetical protein
LSPTSSTILESCWIGSTKAIGEGFSGGILIFHYTFYCSFFTNFYIPQFNFVTFFGFANLWFTRRCGNGHPWVLICATNHLYKGICFFFFWNKLAPSSCFIYSCELLQR